ncbi:type II toxin-antitoxin system VapB family antitoxin [Streptomyces sp. NPDC014882]|uniref:type II toxin-antitoxin system VapB family antitoxin n=1 Tax=Streptomyces sp. NPDC014882 TaxID=3364927 RepID=UPI0036F8E0BE
MPATRIDIDDDVPESAHGSVAEQQEHAVRISRHFERARDWGAVEDAERMHRTEKRSR